jgi:3D (Asp-Asp-Asp) domain-containing protein
MGTAALVVGWFAADHVDELTTAAPPAAAVSASPAPSVEVPVMAAAPAPSAAPTPAPTPRPAPEEPLGTFRMTRYYVAEESGFARPDGGDGDAVLASAGHGGVTIYDDRGCKPLAHLGARFAEVLDVQGTGRLRDGRVVNISGPCRCASSPCYRTVGDHAPWGLNATSRPLVPFRSVAVDTKVIPLGTLLYIPELDGLTMPGQEPWGGFTHDGCVIATDVGGHIDGLQIDFFVGRFAYKKALDARRKMKHVTVMRGEQRCAAHKPSRSAKAGT